LALDLETARRVWPDVLAKVPGRFTWRLSQVEQVAVTEPDVLVVAPKPGYTADENVCTPDVLERVGRELQKVIRRPVAVRFQPATATADSPADGQDGEPRRADPLTSDPLVQKVVELFEARPVQMDYDGPDAGATA
jgi:DNA polymerase-3 subunit gamma/tau